MQGDISMQEDSNGDNYAEHILLLWPTDREGCPKGVRHTTRTNYGREMEGQKASSALAKLKIF